MDCFSMFKLMPYAKRTNFISSILTRMLFISFFCLINLSRISNTILNRTVRSRYSWLVSDIKWESFSLPFCGYRFFADKLYWIEEVTLYPSLLSTFIVRTYWILSDAFSESFKIIIWFFVLNSINMVYYFGF